MTGYVSELCRKGCIIEYKQHPDCQTPHFGMCTPTMTITLYNVNNVPENSSKIEDLLRQADSAYRGVQLGTIS